MIRSKTYLAKVDQSAILGPPVGHFRFRRRYGVAGGERVPPVPLGWYFNIFDFDPP